MDLKILGIGTDTHIAFDKPGTSDTNGAVLTQITEAIIEANSAYFN